MSFYLERKMAILAQRVRTKLLADHQVWPPNPFVASLPEVLAFNKGDYGRAIAAKEVKEALAEHRAKEALELAEPADPRLQLFGGGWTPHKPGDFVPDFTGRRIELLVRRPDRTGGSPPEGAENGHWIVQHNLLPQCWEHKPYANWVVGYRYKD